MMAGVDKFTALADYAEWLLDRRRDPRPWIEENLWIRTKDRRVIPFGFNAVQQDYYAHRTPWDIILKPRQQGFTTIICALFFADGLLRPNTTSVIVAHDFDSSEKIFRIVQLFWERLDAQSRKEAGRPRFSNRREFLWPRLNSHFYVGTAGAGAFGRGQTIQNLHCSEFAFWPRPEEVLASLTQAVPAGGRVVIESTANGVGNHFHTLWEEARSKEGRFTPHFYTWFEDPSYTAPVQEEEAPAIQLSLTDEERKLAQRYKLTVGQIKWRREKQRELRERFRQEYPEDDMTCFLARGGCCFDTDALQRVAARIAAGPGPGHATGIRVGKESWMVAPGRLLLWETPKDDAEYVIGADVGEGLEHGDASCAIVLERRSGRQVAELHGQIAPDRFAHLLNALGRWYNRALLAVERNNHGHSTLNTLRNVSRYPALYYHVRYDQGRHARPVLGWPTDQATKPILVDDLAAAITQEAIGIESAALVDECLTFVMTESGSQEAAEGAHDDRVMAAGIAWQARKRAVTRGFATRPEGM
jgi:hypothetical protein